MRFVRMSVYAIDFVGYILSSSEYEDVVDVATKGIVHRELQFRHRINDSAINFLKQNLSKDSAHLWTNWYAVGLVMVAMPNDFVEPLRKGRKDAYRAIFVLVDVFPRTF